MEGRSGMGTEGKHTHIAEDGTVYEHTHHDHVHSHDHGHDHSHGHVHTNTKAVLNRLSRAIGHLESIKRMVEEGRDCSEVLIQLSAVKAAINNTGKVILQDPANRDADIAQLVVQRFRNA